jgi:hypothetical protein
MSLHLLRLMIYRSRLSRKKTGRKKRPKNIEEDRRRGEIFHVGKKMAQPTRPFHPDRLITISGYP